MFLNKRTQKRRSLYYYLPVVDQGTSALLGRIGDITSEGALLLTHAELAVGQQIDIAISLPSDLKLGTKELCLNATVQWTSPDVNPDITLVGCRFSEVSPKAQRIIAALVDAIGFAGDNGPRAMET